MIVADVNEELGRETAARIKAMNGTAKFFKVKGRLRSRHKHAGSDHQCAIKRTVKYCQNRPANALPKQTIKQTIGHLHNVINPSGRTDLPDDRHRAFWLSLPVPTEAGGCPR